MMKCPPFRRLFRFSLRTMLALMVVFSLWLGGKVNRARQQKAAVEWVRRTGGFVIYDYEILLLTPLPITDSERKPPGPQWLHDLIGVDYFATVEYVGVGREGWLDLSPLAKLKGLKIIRLGLPEEMWDPPDDAGKLDISPLTNLKNLRYLILFHTRVSDADAARLQATLPDCEIMDMLQNWNREQL